MFPCQMILEPRSTWNHIDICGVMASPGDAAVHPVGWWEHLAVGFSVVVGTAKGAGGSACSRDQVCLPQLLRS